MEEASQNEGRLAELFGLNPTGELFAQALTHPSFAHETPDVPHNQRLEFLGDAVLDFVVSEELYLRMPDADEGLLTRTRAQVVSTSALARFARHHEIGSCLRFGKGAAQSNLTDSDNVLADAVEALIAAAYLEGGIERTKVVCGSVLDFGLSRLSEAGARDAKSELQEKVQALGMKAPAYRVVGTRGPAHEVEFEVEVSVRGIVLARGRGRSKRNAEREAAARALDERSYVGLVVGPAEEDEGGEECHSDA